MYVVPGARDLDDPCIDRRSDHPLGNLAWNVPVLAAHDEHWTPNSPPRVPPVAPCEVGHGPAAASGSTGTPYGARCLRKKARTSSGACGLRSGDASIITRRAISPGSADAIRNA